MTLDDAIQKTEKYFSSQDTHPRLVNVNNQSDAEAFRLHFSMANVSVITVADLSMKDENLSEDVLFHSINIADGKMLLTRISTYYKLLGEQQLRNLLQKIQCISRADLKLVVLCYQCEGVLQDLDRRFRSYVYLVDGEKTALPQLVFTAYGIPVPQGVSVVEGIHNFSDSVERYVCQELFVYTKKTRTSYPASLFIIRERSNAYEAICALDPTTNQLSEKYGTQSEWEEALADFHKYGSWENYISEQIVPTTNLEGAAYSWQNYSDFKRWLFFIGLKLYGTKHNWCLNQAALASESKNDLVRGVFRCILKLNYSDNDYWVHYDQRKTLIKLMGNPDSEVNDYCSMVRSKGIDALYYLTDSTKAERNLIFELLDTYSQALGRERIVSALEHVYSDLYDYLQPYSYNIPLLDYYFNEYKFQKVFNRIDPEFLRIVNEQSEKREFNLLLPSRSEIVDKVTKIDTAVYFMDAMGVEYLSFIMAECKRHNLLAYVKLGHCEIPSLTSFNKEFVQTFKDGGADLIPDDNGIKSLDELKHHGEEEFDYRNNKLPTYLSRELEIIAEIIEKISTKIKAGKYKKAVMISDHGSSRLCVINGQENKLEMTNKGKHSGRCCPISDFDEKPDCAIEENDFWALANYDRFKGGRAANIEVHGGATLEEVVIPVIEIVEMPHDIEIILMNDEVKFSRHKKNAVLQLFSKTPLDALSIRIKELNNEYDGIANGQLFDFSIPELRKEGTYHIEVLYHGNALQSGFEFKAINTDYSERELL